MRRFSVTVSKKKDGSENANFQSRPEDGSTGVSSFLGSHTLWRVGFHLPPPLLCICSNTGTEAELVVRDEVLPFMDLLEASSERTSEDQTTNGVSGTSSAVGIKLTAFIAWSNVDFGQVTTTGNLNVWRCLEEVCAGDCSVGNETSTIPTLCAVGDHFSFGVTDGGWLVRSIETEVFDRVDEDVLAMPLLCRGTIALLAIVVTELTMCRVSFCWQIGWVVVGTSASNSGKGHEENLLNEHSSGKERKDKERRGGRKKGGEEQWRSWWGGKGVTGLDGVICWILSFQGGPRSPYWGGQFPRCHCIHKRKSCPRFTTIFSNDLHEFHKSKLFLALNARFNMQRAIQEACSPLFGMRRKENALTNVPKNIYAEMYERLADKYTILGIAAGPLYPWKCWIGLWLWCTREGMKG